MAKIEPIHYSDLIDTFGEPGTQEGFVTRDLPFTLRASWNDAPITRFYGHEYIADAFIEVLEDIGTAYGYDFIQQHGLDEYGGCYADRETRKGGRKSVHAWGLAVDYMPSRGLFLQPPMTPALVVEAFEDAGFIWGGRWTDTPDGMHFTAVIE